MPEETKRKVGRPRIHAPGTKRPGRKFYMLEKSPLNVALMEDAHKDYRERHEGHDTSDARLLQIALRHYIG